MRFIISLLLLCSLFSCSSNNNTIHILTDNAYGVAKNSKVLYKGMEIGRVKEMKIHNSDILISLRIQPDVKVPRFSTFTATIGKNGFGNNNISVDFSHEKDFYKGGDTVETSLGTYVSPKAIIKGLFKSVLENIESY